MMSKQEVPSPCIKVCQLDPATQICLGCQRTMQEIADWLELSDVEKRAVLTRIESRRRQAAA
jgi:predicted Fe-S protein YdhL (DUF1289 family)